MFPWRFSSMYAWYAQHDEIPTEKIVALTYHAQARRKHQQHLEPFIKARTSYVGANTFIDYYRQELFFVEHDSSKLSYFQFGLHRCDVRNATKLQHVYFALFDDHPFLRPHYMAITRKYSFPKEILLPHHGDAPNFLRDFPHPDYKQKLLDLMRKPWTYGTPPTPINPQERTSALPIRCPVFTQYWTFETMHAFGFRQDNDHITWSVRCIGEGSGDGPCSTAYVFDTITMDEIEFQQAFATAHAT